MYIFIYSKICFKNCGICRLGNDFTGARSKIYGSLSFYLTGGWLSRICVYCLVFTYRPVYVKSGMWCSLCWILMITIKMNIIEVLKRLYFPRSGEWQSLWSSAASGGAVLEPGCKAGVLQVQLHSLCRSRNAKIGHESFQTPPSWRNVC